MHLHAGLTTYGPEDAFTSAGYAKRFSHLNTLSITGFRADTVAEVIDESFHLPLADVQRTSKAQNLLDMEARCLELARKTYNSPHKTIPMGHLLTLTGSTRARSPKEQDSTLLQAYFDVLAAHQKTLADGSVWYPPADRRAFYNITWQQMFRTCSGRRYFSTEGGRVGIGPPDIKPGDVVCVFYDSRPVYILRPAHKNGTEGWLLEGDAFLHGFMELNETPIGDRGFDEVFDIF